MISKTLMINIGGAIGAIGTSVSFLPQVYTTFTKKTTKGLSLWLLILTLIASIGWLIYSYNIEAWYQFATHCFVTSVMIFMFILYFTYRNQ